MIKSNVCNLSGSAHPIEEFASFPRLPAELRLKIWRHALPGPHVLEIQLCQNLSGYQFAIESKPQMPETRAINTEARDVFFRTYMPISLNRHLGVTPVSPRLARWFFSPAKDTVYITEARNAPTTYTKDSLWFLHHDFLRNVRYLAIQAETFTCNDFDIVPPYIWINLASMRKASFLKGVITTFRNLETMSVVVGDDFSLAPQYLAAICGFTRKPQGKLELTELARGRQATEKSCSAEDQVLAWIQFLFGHIQIPVNIPEIEVCQALRGGKLTMIDVLGLLEMKD